MREEALTITGNVLRRWSREAHPRRWPLGDSHRGSRVRRPWYLPVSQASRFISIRSRTPGFWFAPHEHVRARQPHFGSLATTLNHLPLSYIVNVRSQLRQLSMGPEASLSLLLGHTIQEIIYSDPHGVPENAELEAAAVAVMITFQAGVITSILGLLRLGFLDVVLSRALLRGFITAIGVVSTFRHSTQHH